MSTTGNGRAAAAGASHWDLLYMSLSPLPLALMIAALACDLLFLCGAGASFATLSEWLVGGMLVAGAFAFTEGVVLYVSLGRIGPSRVGVVHAIGYALALLLSLSNVVYRLVDGARAAVPAGVGLTAASLLLLLAAARLGRGIEVDCGSDEAEDFDLP